MAKICLCLCAKTIKRNLEILQKYRKYADIAELRVDCLDQDERYLIRRFPEQAGLPVILTIRRAIDGGKFFGGEGSRVSLLARGLAYADQDRRLNFAYVDIEEDLDVPNLEEAARTFGTRIIRSWHSLEGCVDQIQEKIQRMKCMGDDIVKIAVTAKSTSDVLCLLRAARKFRDREKIFLCMGEYGTYSRILTGQFESYLTYTSALDEKDSVKGAEGQIDVKDLVDVFHYRDINKKTKIFGAVGIPPLSSDNIRFFNSAFLSDEINAVYVPFPATSIPDFMELAAELSVSGLSINDPYREEVIPFLKEPSAGVTSSGACDTIFKTKAGWTGINAAVMSFSDSLLAFYSKKKFFRNKATLVCGGSMTKEIAAELARLGFKVLLLDQNVQRARELAGLYKFVWGGLDSRGVERITNYRDIIIIAVQPGIDTEALGLYDFCGQEAVMSISAKSCDDILLKRAAKAGCRIIDGSDMLAKQVKYQYSQFTGKELPA